jgi:hypothetical protein
MLPKTCGKLDQGHKIIPAQARAFPAGTWLEVWRKACGGTPKKAAGMINRGGIMKEFAIEGSFKPFSFCAHGQAHGLGYRRQCAAWQPGIALLPIPII